MFGAEKFETYRVSWNLSRDFKYYTFYSQEVKQTVGMENTTYAHLVIIKMLVIQHKYLYA